MSEIRESLKEEWLSQDPDALLICFGGMREAAEERSRREQTFVQAGMIVIPEGLNRIEFMTTAGQVELLELLSRDPRTPEEIEGDRKMWDAVHRAAVKEAQRIII